jgi:2-oxoisovalerate dehydrogenase E1 component
VLVVTFGNGVAMSLAAAGRVDATVSVFDLRWLAPLPVEHLLKVAADFPRVDGGYAGRVSRVTSLDSLIPLGPAASTVLLSEADIVAALCAALKSGHEPPHRV